MNKRFWFFLSLIVVAILSVVLMPSEDSFADDGIQATFDYNTSRIEQYLPYEMVRAFQTTTVDVDGLYVKDPVKSNIELYYDYEWTVNGQVVDLNTYAVLEDTTFVAVWTPREYTIYYKYLTNEEKSQITNFKETDTYSIEQSVVYYRPERPNYFFLDWYSSAQLIGDVCIFTAPYSVGDKVLYAKFQPEEFLITYHTDANNPDNPRSYNVESPDYVLEAPTLDGHIFKGWYLDKECTYQYITITQGSSGNLDLYPLWELNEYSVKYIMPDGKTQIVKTKYGETAQAPNNYNTMFQLVIYKGDRHNITSNVEIAVEYINIWYLYVIGLAIILAIIIVSICTFVRKRKQLHKLRYIYQSNFKRK